MNKNQRFAFINAGGIFGYLVIVIYWSSNLVEKYAVSISHCLLST